ncbi:MAG TPA: YigZ family protein [Longimicrobiales bacterium]|nr:YigZ family protein [Longimicrobiales bacterium]
MPDPARYPVPARAHRAEHVVRRSRFVTTLARAADPAEAQAFVRRIREEHPDATHHCWAFVAGPPGSTSHIGMSDDGEPHGTAGRPMLTALLHSGVGEIVAVCSRWFGGVKLGTGGLSRAYADSVKLALASLPTVERVERSAVVVSVPYAQVDALGRLVEEHDGRVESEDYGERVTWRVAVPSPALEAFTSAAARLGNGARVAPG